MEQLNTIKTEPVKSTGNSLFNKIKNLSEKTMQTAKDSTEKVFYEIKTLEKNSETTNSFFFIRYVFVFLLIFLILINVLQALKLLPDMLVGILKPILLFFGHSIEDTVKQIGQTTIDGSKAIDDLSTSGIQSSIQEIKEDVDRKEDNNNVPQPDDSIEAVNRARGTHQDKLGYCYVGTDRGYRSCIDVETKDECLSGDIFPTRDICINPNLRQ
tara:strand:+ start:342 stop:980 length:639 start_codon:yes stop_codon:yes gene_type:complete